MLRVLCRLIVTGVALAGCRAFSGPSPASSLVAGKAQAWLTTGDQRQLLVRQPDPRVSTVAAAGAIVIDVDASRTYQEMLGFGAAMTDASAFLMQNSLSESDRAALLRELFSQRDGIGLSFIRIPMGASDFSVHHYSYDDVSGDSSLTSFSVETDEAAKIPLLQRAVAINPGITLVASPWSPPGWMKSTNSLIKGTLLPRYYDSFAEYFVKFIEAYGAKGLKISAITLQNEPHFEPDNYPGMRLGPAARADVIAHHIGPRFAQMGIGTQIWDWDHNWDEPQSPLAVLADTGARRFVQGVAWHCYNGYVSAQGKVHDAYPDKDAYFTECSGGEWSPKFDENLKWMVANLIIGATRNWARGVALWNLALDENYGPHLGGCGNCRGVVTINSKTRTYSRNVEYYALAHASKFVVPGAYRIESTSPSANLQSVAFRNPDGSKVLIVLNAAGQDQSFIARTGVEGLSYTLPAASVVTLLWR